MGVTELNINSKFKPAEPGIPARFHVLSIHPKNGSCPAFFVITGFINEEYRSEERGADMIMPSFPEGLECDGLDEDSFAVTGAQFPAQVHHVLEAVRAGDRQWRSEDEPSFLIFSIHLT